MSAGPARLSRAGAPGRRKQSRSSVVPFAMLAPSCVLFSLFVIYPILASLRLSLYEWDGAGPLEWAGFRNYAALLGDPVFATALRNNVLWLFAYLAVAPPAGLALALFLNQSIRGIRVVRSLFFLPFVISQVVVGLVFGWFFNSEFGLFNHLLARLGLPAWAPLDSERWAIFVPILAGLWPQTAYCFVLYLTGLTTIRPELIESARMDGAKGLSMLWHVVLPQLRPVTFVVVMVCIVGALRSFDLVMIITLGGPYNSSNVLAYYMYEQTFLSSRYGYGSTLAAVLFLWMSGCVGFFLWRLLRPERP